MGVPGVLLDFEGSIPIELAQVYVSMMGLGITQSVTLDKPELLA